MIIETVFIKVKDIYSSKKWYQNTLDLSLKWEDLEKKVVAFDCGETDLTIVQEKNYVPYNDATFNILVDDIESFHNNLINKNVPLSKVQQWNDIYYFDIQDLDGNYLQIVSKII
ncbi:VOC family protein (plasmid) [Staphylococcus haemolyticus]|uniref:VOC family protein n=1 Tax=Staphylococcus haemolyticus TaxID=1283 RepID=UPI0015D8BCD1|nr:VOC family protein [Staphylococcus haemolyticus]WQL37083.1 VOC family protein [Staphylococcus haemolyticus]